MKKLTSRQIGAAGAVFATLALAVSPLAASAASNTANTTINATIGDTISVTSSGTVTISLAPTGSGVVSSASDTITVNTNRTAGYNLKLADTDTTTTLVSGGNSIAASTNTVGAPATLASNSWGFAVAGAPFDASYSAENNNGSSTSKWAGMPSSASPTTLKTTATTATNDTTTVWYGVKATSAQPGGSYTDQVTYTATTN